MIVGHILGIPVEENVVMLAGGVAAGSGLVIVFRARIAGLADRVRKLWRQA